MLASSGARSNGSLLLAAGLVALPKVLRERHEREHGLNGRATVRRCPATTARDAPYRSCPGRQRKTSDQSPIAVKRPQRTMRRAVAEAGDFRVPALHAEGESHESDASCDDW